MKRMEDLVKLALSISGHEGVQGTAVAGLKIVRANEKRRINHVYNPSLCLIIQGSKEVQCGSSSIHCSTGDTLVVGTHLPTTGRILSGSTNAPYLSLMVEIKQSIVSSVMTADTRPAENAKTAHCFKSEKANEAIVVTFHRLLQCLNEPNSIDILSPMIIRELVYRFTETDHGEILRMMGTQIPHPVRQSIEHIRKTFRAPIDMQKLAKSVGLSVPTFHRHFKIFCSMSPLQYQKQLRLQEARTLLIQTTSDVASIGYEVGYESPSQFSREYLRLFGKSPSADRDLRSPAH